MNIEKYLNQKKNEIDRCLEEILALPSNNEATGKLADAMRYAVFPGGKRIRPILCLAVSELLNGNIENTLYPASTIELIHTYSLIHDDLPSMDNDDMRRGKPTCHIEYGEAIALLAGNALLSLSFSAIAECNNISDKIRIEIIRELADSSGFNGLMGGQAADILLEGSPANLELLNYIHVHKTARLFQAATTIGALASNASSLETKNMVKFGQLIGHAFQIQDDIIDVTGDEKKAGKKLRKDSEQKKLSAIKVLGYDTSVSLCQEKINQALELLKGYGSKADRLKDLVLYLSAREK